MIIDMLKAKEYKGEPVKFMQAKLDGHRVMIERSHDGSFTSLTRSGCDIISKLIQVEHILLRLEMLPFGTVIDCELHSPGVHATSVKTMINDADPKLRLTAFAMPFCNRIDFRTQDLEYVMRHLQDFGFDTPDTWSFDAPVKLSSAMIDQYRSEAAASKLEGYVLKQAHYAGWYKIKPLRDLDAFIVGHQISKSTSFAGGLKSFDVALMRDGQMVTIATVGSGYDADFRMKCRPADHLYRVCKIEYDCVASQGRLKFPRFAGWRDDKKMEECLWDQLPEGDDDQCKM